MVIQNYPQGYIGNVQGTPVTNVPGSQSIPNEDNSRVGTEVKDFRDMTQREKNKLAKELRKEGLEVDKRSGRIVPQGTYYTKGRNPELRKRETGYDAKVIQTSTGKEILSRESGKKTVAYVKTDTGVKVVSTRETSPLVKEKVEKYNKSSLGSTPKPQTQQSKDVVYDDKGQPVSKAYSLQTKEEKAKTAEVSANFINTKEGIKTRGEQNGSVRNRLPDRIPDRAESTDLGNSLGRKEVSSQIQKPQSYLRPASEVFGKPNLSGTISKYEDILETGRRRTSEMSIGGAYIIGSAAVGYGKGFVGFLGDLSPISFDTGRFKVPLSGGAKLAFDLTTKPQQTVSLISEEASQRPIGFLGELAGSTKAGKVISQVASPKLSVTEIKTSTATVPVKSLSIESNLPFLKGRSFIVGSVIDSPTRTGVSTFSGAPKVGEFFKQMPEGAEIRISNPVETKIVRENLKRESTVVSPERAQSYIPTTQNILRKTEGTKSRFIEGFPEGTERLSPEGTRIALGIAKEEGAYVSGSFSRSAQLAQKYDLPNTESFIARTVPESDLFLNKIGGETFVPESRAVTKPFELNKRPRDIDIHLEGSPEQISLVAQNTLERLRRAGIDARLKGQGGVVKNAIEVRQANGEYAKAIEFLGEGTTPIADIPPDTVLGFTKEGKKIDIGGVKATSLSEELRGTMQGTARLRNVDGKLDIFPPEKRVKDIASVSVSARTLYESQRIKRPGLKRDIEKFESFYPEELVREQVSEVKVPIADFSPSRISSFKEPSVSPTTILASSSVGDASTNKVSSVEVYSSPLASAYVSSSPSLVPSISPSSPSLSSPSGFSSSPKSPSSSGLSPSSIPSIISSPSPGRSSSPSIISPPSQSSPSLSSPSISPPSISPPSRSPPSSSPPSVPSFQPPSLPAPSRPNNDSKKKSSRYTVQVRRRGKFESKGVFDDSSLAFQKGRSVVENTAAASLRVLDEGGRALSGFTMPSGFTKSKKDSSIYVQKREKRIGTFGEKQEITYQGIRARRLI